MGLGQTMITTAFLVLITIAAMNANKMVVDRDSNYYEQEAYRQAAIMANSLLGEILSKRFDENSNVGASDTTYQSATNFSDNLGPDNSEGYNIPHPDVTFSSNYQKFYSINDPGIIYDDVDDYNNYQRRGSSGDLTDFLLTVNVNYAKTLISGDTTIVTTSNKTHLKLIKITVINTKYLPLRDIDGDGIVDTTKLTFSTVKTY